MDTQQRESVNAAAAKFNSAQRFVDREYKSRVAGHPPLRSDQGLEERTARIDHELGQVLAYFTHEQMNEYMRQTSPGSIV